MGTPHIYTVWSDPVGMFTANYPKSAGSHWTVSCFVLVKTNSSAWHSPPLLQLDPVGCFKAQPLSTHSHGDACVDVVTYCTLQSMLRRPN